ncbi:MULTISPECIES: phytanoyl-CoA dioxygenase family protein [unclassified Psychrobacter]|uniref:phytanoyl-CoA dioxygenase family protein n=1 Tax=unclassified Psychrobacter TaxID=196806 RepID=UPI0036D36CCB
MYQPIDKLLIEARDYSVRLEASAAQDLSMNLDNYLSPSWTVRKVLEGYERYAKTGTNDELTYMRFREAFSETEGRSNRVFSNVIADHIGKTEYDFSQTIFGEDVDAANTVKTGLYHLKHYGFYKTKLQVPIEIVESLKNKVLNSMEADHGSDVGKAIFGTDDAPLQIKGKHGPLTTFEEMYEISSDPILLAMVQEYMGVPPIFNTPVAFLNSARKVKSQRELSDTAQLYHHDMHRLQFVKLFIYLTDVDMESGPHTLIPGTHRNRPSEMWSDGRHTDGAVIKSGLMDNEVNIVGPAGTVFLVDTSALHKGANPISNHRLMAQVQYTNSLFGRPWPETERKISRVATSENRTLNQAADLVRRYAQRSGVRFMQNYI